MTTSTSSEALKLCIGIQKKLVEKIMLKPNFSDGHFKLKSSFATKNAQERHGIIVILTSINTCKRHTKI